MDRGQKAATGERIGYDVLPVYHEYQFHEDQGIDHTGAYIVECVDRYADQRRGKAHS